MILLKPDYLLFQMSSGETIPCSAEIVTVELMGQSASGMDPGIIKNAAAAVLHYFKEELGRDSVSIQEFSAALEHVLRKFGFSVTGEEEASGQPPAVAEVDLFRLADAAGGPVELLFFQFLREEVSRFQARAQAPGILRFTGLRASVKQLLGARRWNGRCRAFRDQVVDYLRDCFSHHHDPGSTLVIR